MTGYTGSKGWSEIKRGLTHTATTNRQCSTKIGRRLLSAILLAGLCYTIASAMCATGSSCAIANGDWFNWIASTVIH